MPKAYVYCDSLFAKVADVPGPYDFGWEDSIVDLSDFIPLAELVRSFQPQDSREVPEFDLPDGVDDFPDNFNPPNEYTDPTDVFEAVSSAKSEILQKKIARDNENVINSKNPQTKQNEAVEAAESQKE